MVYQILLRSIVVAWCLVGVLTSHMPLTGAMTICIIVSIELILTTGGIDMAKFNPGDEVIVLRDAVGNKWTVKALISLSAVQYYNIVRIDMAFVRYTIITRESDLELAPISHLHPLLGMIEYDKAHVHLNHNVITNVALGKEFKYCKDCKVEVL